VEPVGQWAHYAKGRIRNYRFEYWNGGDWTRLAEGETPSQTTILRVPRVSARKVRLMIEASRQMPHIAEIGVYDEPG
jgi:alpha-L-fucosidase